MIVKNNSYILGNYTDLSEIAKVQFERRVNETMSVFRGAMEIVPVAKWERDPINHLKGNRPFKTF